MIYTDKVFLWISVLIDKNADAFPNTPANKDIVGDLLVGGFGWPGLSSIISTEYQPDVD